MTDTTLTRDLATKRPANIVQRRVANLPATIDVEPVRPYQRRPAVRGGPKLGHVLAGALTLNTLGGVAGVALATGNPLLLAMLFGPAPLFLF